MTPHEDILVVFYYVTYALMLNFGDVFCSRDRILEDGINFSLFEFHGGLLILYLSYRTVAV